MTSVGRGDGELLRFVTCLHILLFLNSRSILRMGVHGWGVGWFVDVIILWSLTLKLALIKNSTFNFGATVIVQQPSSLLNICTFKMKSNLGTKTCAIANHYSSKYYRGKKLKTCQEQPYLVSGHFIEVLCKATTCSRRSFLNGPKSGRLVQVWLYF